MQRSATHRDPAGEDPAGEDIEYTSVDLGAILTSMPTERMGGTGKQAKVSIGIPIFNGERFLASALDSVIAQTFPDLEIVIVDNCSEDRSLEISQEYASFDDRISVYSNPRNLGAARNFALALSHSHGQYFKWLAADDLLSPTFVDECVSVLDTTPDVAVVTAKVSATNENGSVLTPDDDGVITAEYGERWQLMPFPAKLSGSSPSARFESVLMDVRAGLYTELFYGLFRGETLRRQPPLESHMGNEKALMARVLLSGRAIRIEETLHYRRFHPEHFGSLDREETLVGLDPDQKTNRIRSNLEHFRGYWSVIRDSKLPLLERGRCARALAKKVVVRGNSKLTLAHPSHQHDPVELQRRSTPSSVDDSST